MQIVFIGSPDEIQAEMALYLSRVSSTSTIPCDTGHGATVSFAFDIPAAEPAEPVAETPQPAVEPASEMTPAEKVLHLRKILVGHVDAHKSPADIVAWLQTRYSVKRADEVPVDQLDDAIAKAVTLE
jgi:hypothetical protein